MLLQKLWNSSHRLMIKACLYLFFFSCMGSAAESCVAFRNMVLTRGGCGHDDEDEEPLRGMTITSVVLIAAVSNLCWKYQIHHLRRSTLHTAEQNQNPSARRHWFISEP